MESNNPVLRNAPQFKSSGYAGFDERSRTATSAPPASLEDLYAAPAAGPAQTGRMTYDDVVMRTAMVLGTVVAGAAVGWFIPGFAIIGAVIGLVLGLVNAFKREPSPALILAYAAFQGVFLGGISYFFELQYPGIAVQAVLATFATFGVMLVLYRSGAIRATPKFRKILLGAVLGYAVFCLINFGFVMFGAGEGLRTGGLGLVIGAFGATLAALTLVLDFDFIETGVKNGIPQRYAWSAAFGLAVSLIWLYVEFLRIIAILRGGE